MIRWLFTLVLICAGSAGAAQGFDVLGRIERMMLYPFDDRTATPPDGIAAHVWERQAETLVVWTAPARSGRPTVVYFQGNAGNLGARAARFAHFLSAGLGLIALSPRGAGGSTGTPSEASLTADAVALLGALETWQPGLRPGQVILYGESLGTAVVIAALAEAKPPVAGVILEAPFRSIPEVARASGQIPESLLERIRDRWPSETRSYALTPPLLVIHGTDDDVIPFDHGRAIFNAAPSRNKDFLRVEGAGHADLWRPQVIARIIRFARDQSAK